MVVRKIAKPQSATSSTRKSSPSASEDHETEAKSPSLRAKMRLLYLRAQQPIASAMVCLSSTFHRRLPQKPGALIPNCGRVGL
jgi:hypothetical protein